MRLPVGQDVYRRKFAGEPPLDLINRFFETDPTNTVEGSALLSRPVTVEHIKVDGAPLRKLITSPGAFKDDLFVVVDTRLLRRSAIDGSWQTLVSGLAGATPQAEYEDTALEAEILTGPGFNHLFLSDGTALRVYVEGTTLARLITMPLDAQGQPYVPGSLAQVAKHLLVSCKGTDRFYYIPPGELTIDPLHFYTAEKQSDSITAIRVVGDKVLVLGTSTIEFWHLSAQGIAQDIDTLAPYPANALNVGCLPGTALVVKDTLIFVGSDHIVYSLGSELKALSPHFLVEIIRLSEEVKKQQEQLIAA